MDPAAPFGGVKASGYGRELGPEGLDSYVATTSISVASTAGRPAATRHDPSGHQPTGAR